MLSEFQRPRLDLFLGDFHLVLGAQTKLMGVLNATPDSFSDGGRFYDPPSAVRQALVMEEEGAHFIDVGGESTRPGARPVSAREEIRRIKPILKKLSRRIKIPLSVDTYKEETAAAALDEGAVLVNDITALKNKKRLARRIARYGAGVVLMHMRGAPRTMQKNIRYRNLLKEIRDFLSRAVGCALEAGIPRSRILLDPGFGFGKTPQQNLEILARLDYFSALKLPLLAGLSRKSFIGHWTGAPVDGRLFGSLGAAAAAIAHGAHILRVHDVRAHKEMTRVMDETFFLREAAR